MTLKFNEAISIMEEKLLEAPKPKYQTYSQDAAEISAKMDQELIKINSIFKGTVSNWEDTIEFYKVELPKLNFQFLRLKMPFTVEPQPVLVFSSDEIQPVNLKTSVNHPAVENGYLNGEKLTQLFIWDLNRVIDGILKITCSSGKIYKLVFATKMMTHSRVLINILAKENASQKYPSICYEFFISFIFPNQSFCYTFVSNFIHQISAAAEVDLKEKAKVANYFKVLLQTLVNQYSKTSTLDLPIVYNSMQVELGIEIVSNLFEAIPLCIPHLQNPGPFISAYGKLLQLKQSDSVQLSELKEVFGLK